MAGKLPVDMEIQGGVLLRIAFATRLQNLRPDSRCYSEKLKKRRERAGKSRCFAPGTSVLSWETCIEVGGKSLLPLIPSFLLSARRAPGPKA